MEASQRRERIADVLVSCPAGRDARVEALLRRGRCLLGAGVRGPGGAGRGPRGAQRVRHDPASDRGELARRAGDAVDGLTSGQRHPAGDRAAEPGDAGTRVPEEVAGHSNRGGRARRGRTGRRRQERRARRARPGALGPTRRARSRGRRGRRHPGAGLRGPADVGRALRQPLRAGAGAVRVPGGRPDRRCAVSPAPGPGGDLLARRLRGPAAESSGWRRAACFTSPSASTRASR